MDVTGLLLVLFSAICIRQGQIEELRIGAS